MIYSRVEAEVEKVILESGAKILKKPESQPVAFDFGIEHGGKKIAIEVKGLATLSMFSGMFGYQVPIAQKAGFNELWLVTGLAHPPLDKLPISKTIPVRWLTLDEMALALGVPSPKDVPFREKRVSLVDVLGGQFEERVLTSISTDDQLEKLLRLGARQEQVTVVFADIGSFTEIVHNSEPASLNEMLGDYYRYARNLTQFFQGTFDKVIGDAVLSVFNYPPIAEAPSMAVLYATELIKGAKDVLSKFFARSTSVVETGVRVGIATGDVWPIDVGYKVPQVSFIGNPLNLAARLQRHAELNGLIACQATWNLVERDSLDLINVLCPEQVQFPKGQLAGVGTAINARSVSSSSLFKNDQR